MSLERWAEFSQLSNNLWWLFIIQVGQIQGPQQASLCHLHHLRTQPSLNLAPHH